MTRFAVATTTDQSAHVWIATILSLLYTTLTLLIRAWIKRITFGSEDVALLVAQLLAWGEFVAIMVGLSNGFARNLELLAEAHLIAAAKIFLSSQVLFIVSLAATKIAVVLLLRRIFARLAYRHASVLCNTFLGVVVAWGVGSALTSSVDCDGQHILPGHPAAQCPSSETRWLAITVLDCLIELCIVILSVYLVADLQMKSDDKFMTGAAFACRLGLVPISILHYQAYTIIVSRDGEGASFSILVILRQVALCYSLLSATWPFSRSLMKEFNTGGLMITTIATGAGSGSRSGGLRSAQQDTVASTTSKGKSRLRNDRVMYTTSARYQGDRLGEDRRFGSEEMIIRRDDTFTVVHDS